jgi:hypothetical protein
MSKAIDAALEIGKMALPPKDGSFPETKRWRWLIVCIVGANSIALAFHIALACGMVPFYPGFASASDMTAAKVEARSGRLEQLMWTMFELRTRQCDAIDKGISPRGFTIQLEQQQKIYYSLTNEFHQLPTCQELK